MHRGKFVKIAIPILLAFLILNSAYLLLATAGTCQPLPVDPYDFPRLDTLYMVEAWPAATARTMALECKIDVFLGATAESDVEALKAAGWAVTHSGGGLHYCYFGFNCREVQPPWDHMWYDYHGRLPGFNLYPLNVSSFRLALSYIIGCERTAWCWDIMKYIVVRNDFPMPPGFGEWRNPYILEYPEDWAYAEDILIENGFTVDKASTTDRTHWIWYMPNGQVLVGGKNSAHPGSDRLASPADGTMGIYVMSPGPAAVSVEFVARHTKKWNLFFIGEEIEGIAQAYALFHHDIMPATGPIIDTVWYNRNHDIFYLCGSFTSRNPSYLYYTYESSQDIEGGDNDPGMVNEGLDKMLYAVAFFKVKDFDLLEYNVGEDPEVYIPASTHYTVAQPEDIIDVKIERCHKTGVYYEYLIPGVDYELVDSDLHILKLITLYPGDALEVNYEVDTYKRALDVDAYRDVVWLTDWKIFYLVGQMGNYGRDYYDLFKPGHEGWVQGVGYGAGAYNLPWTFGNIHETGVPVGGSMKWQNEGDVVTLNPIKATWVYEAEILNRIYDIGLITRHPITGQEVPWVALTTTETPWTAPGIDGMRIRFTIRDDVTWQDGTPVTAEDIQWNFDYIAHVCPDIGTPFPEFIAIWQFYDHSVVISPTVIDVYVTTTGHWKTLDFAGVALQFPEVIWSDPRLWNYTTSSVGGALGFNAWARSYQSWVGHAPPNGLAGLSCLFGTGPFYLDMSKGGWDESGLAVLSKYLGYWKRLANPGDNDLDMDVDEDDLWFFCGAFISFWKTDYCDFLSDYDVDGDIDEDDVWYFCARFIDFYKCGLHGTYVP
jgi:ABC-type transport system substrate-binding protein